VHLLLRNLMLETGMSHGDRIPSERELAERFGISRMTVRKALNQLVDAGIWNDGAQRARSCPNPPS
jgi:DNA-binding GntR family transcriptional regulator